MLKFWPEIGQRLGWFGGKKKEHESGSGEFKCVLVIQVEISSR